MSHAFLKTKRAALFGLAAAVALTTFSCAGNDTGTSSYTNPVGSTQTGGIITASSLIKWADEGKINAPLGMADRVVVVSVTTKAIFTSTTKKHIPDSVLLDYSTELTTTREEGLGPAGTMMASGPMMDTLVKKLGIDDHTTVVLTIPKGSTDSEHLQQAVAFWTFRYWGFSRERVKLLNGGDDAWEVAGQPLTDAVVAVTPSTYSVTGNQVIKDNLRYSVGEMLTLVDSLNKDQSLRGTWQMLDVRGFTTSPYIANVARGSGPMQFVLDRVNGESTRNRLYPDKETLLARLASISVIDGTTATFLSPTKKTISMCGSSTNSAPTFILFDAVLAVPEGDIGMFDGSAGQWNNYSFAKIRAAGATEAQANAWAFDAFTSGTSLLRVVGTMAAPVPGENPFMPGYFMFSPSQTEVNQIENADRAYVSGTSPTTPGTPSKGTPGGGC